MWPKLELTEIKFYFILQVCELHFVEEDFIREARGFDLQTGKVLTAPLSIKKLKKDAFPSIFKGYPEYSCKIARNQRDDPQQKREAREQSAISQAIEASIKEKELYEKSRLFVSLKELDLKVSNLNLSSFWTLIRKDSYLLFAKLIDSPCPQINYSVQINEALEVNVFFKNVKRLKVGSYSFPLECRSTNLLSEILATCSKVFEEEPKDDVLNSVKDVLRSIMRSDEDSFFQFICEQLSLKEMRKLTYSPEMLVFCTLLYGLAPNAYQFIRKSGRLILLHPTTIQNLCSSPGINPQLEQNEKYFLNYLSQKVTYLSDLDKKVILQFDEIHIKPYADYKSGSIVGISKNSGELATSAHVFMISSVTSSYRDVVHVWPVKSLKYDDLHCMVRKIIDKLEHIGFIVFAVVSDNNSINRSAMSQFDTPVDSKKKKEFRMVYVHPSDKKRPLFYLIDSVHLI
ncbi:hypothetical protein AVEN_105666-1, partial [Araneus ventricosus]